MSAGPRHLRLLGVTSRLFPFVGGAQISLAILLGRLQREHGHTCRLLGDAPFRASRATPVDMRAVRDGEELKDAVRRFRPDVLISSLEAATDAARLAERFGIPHVMWLQSFELCPPTSAEARRWRVIRDRGYPTSEARARTFARADAVLVNSRFLRARMGRFGAPGAHVLAPEFDTRHFEIGPTARRSPAFVTGVCGYGHKGAEIFLDLAARMPRVPFLLVGRVVAPYHTQAERLPNVTLQPFTRPRDFLAKSRVVIVPSQWPEPFGRIAVEAMANGIPTLASRTGGLPELCGHGALTVRAFRSADAWQRVLDRVLGDDDHAARLSSEGNRRAVRFLRGTSTRTLDTLVRRLAARRKPRWDRKGLPILSGAASARSAFALVNANWTRASSGLRRRLAPLDPAEADSISADVHVRHDLSREFALWPPPPDGHLVAVRTWDFGPFPPAWTAILRDQYDRLVVHSRWIRRQALASGLRASRVGVVPLGVDHAIFRPGAAPRATGGRFRLLFVGAPVPRKGFDILLDAYLAAFRRGDPVTLVIKANPDDVFYAGAELRRELRGAMSETTAPEIVFIDRFLTPRALAALYRSADAAVFPYRAEGFCLPILEAMACGCPVVVPRFGAALDLCSEKTAFFVPARRIAVPVPKRFTVNTLGFAADLEAVDFGEVDRSALASVLRTVVAAHPDVRARKAARALKVAARFTWEASAEALAREIARATASRVPVRFQQARAALERHRRVLLTARDLYLRGTG